MNSSLEKLLTRQQVAEQLNVKVSLLETHRKALQPYLPWITFPGSRVVRYRQSDVIKFMQQQ